MRTRPESPPTPQPLPNNHGRRRRGPPPPLHQQYHDIHNMNHGDTSHQKDKHELDLDNLTALFGQDWKRQDLECVLWNNHGDFNGAMESMVKITENDPKEFALLEAKRVLRDEFGQDLRRLQQQRTGAHRQLVTTAGEQKYKEGTAYSLGPLPSVSIRLGKPRSSNNDNAAKEHPQKMNGKQGQYLPEPVLNTDYLQQNISYQVEMARAGGTDDSVGDHDESMNGNSRRRRGGKNAGGASRGAETDDDEDGTAQPMSSNNSSNNSRGNNNNRNNNNNNNRDNNNNNHQDDKGENGHDEEFRLDGRTTATSKKITDASSTFGGRRIKATYEMEE